MRVAVLLLAGCRLNFDAVTPDDAAPIDTPDAGSVFLCVDDFAGSAVDSRWQVIDPLSPFPVQQSGTLSIVLSPGSAGYNGITSVMPIGVGVASSATIELVQAVDQSGFVDCGFSIVSETNVRYSIGIGGGNIVFRIEPDQVVLTYDPIAHRHLRITHDAGTVTWETSPDRIVWTERRTAQVAPIVDASIALFAGAFAVGSSNPGQATFDTFSLITPDCP